MYKSFIRISLIILVNLFAFLFIWIILGAIFWNKWFFLIWAVIFSIIPLLIILFIEIKKVNTQFNTILSQKKDDSNWK